MIFPTWGSCLIPFITLALKRTEEHGSPTVESSRETAIERNLT